MALAHASFYVSKACSHSEQTLVLGSREVTSQKKLAVSSQKMHCLRDKDASEFEYSKQVHTAAIASDYGNVNDMFV